MQITINVEGKVEQVLRIAAFNLNISEASLVEHLLEKIIIEVDEGEVI